jgi:hypothetical protein
LIDKCGFHSIGYDPTTKTLEIAFVSGYLYRYEGVPIDTANGLLGADKMATYFAREIRCQFPYKCVNSRPRTKEIPDAEQKEEDSSVAQATATAQESRNEADHRDRSDSGRGAGKSRAHSKKRRN